MPDIEPNSPEARAKAQNIRNIFYLIAAGNIVFIAILFWKQSTTPRPPEQASPPAIEQPSAGK